MYNNERKLCNNRSTVATDTLLSPSYEIMLCIPIAVLCFPLTHEQQFYAFNIEKPGMSQLSNQQLHKRNGQTETPQCSTLSLRVHLQDINSHIMKMWRVELSCHRSHMKSNKLSFMWKWLLFLYPHGQDKTPRAPLAALHGATMIPAGQLLQATKSCV